MSTLIESDPIKVAKARERIRIAKHRLSGISKATDFVIRISMSVQDRQRLLDLLATMRDEATLENKQAVELESMLLSKPATAA